MRLLNVPINEIRKQLTPQDLTFGPRLSYAAQTGLCVLERGGGLPYLLVSSVDPYPSPRDLTYQDKTHFRVEGVFVKDHNWHPVETKTISIHELRLFVCSSFPLESLFVESDPVVMNAPTARYAEIWRSKDNPSPVARIAGGEMHLALGAQELLSWYSDLPALQITAYQLDECPIMRGGELPRIVGAGLVRWDLFDGRNMSLAIWLLARQTRSVAGYVRFDFFRFALPSEPAGFVTVDTGQHGEPDEVRFRFVPKRRDPSQEGVEEIEAKPKQIEEVDAEIIEPSKAVTIYRKRKQIEAVDAEVIEPESKPAKKPAPNRTRGPKKKPAPQKKPAPKKKPDR